MCQQFPSNDQDIEHPEIKMKKKKFLKQEEVGRYYLEYTILNN